MIANKVSMPNRPVACAPVLVVIHGTRSLSAVEEEFVDVPVTKGLDGAPELSDEAKSWWQSGSQFDTWLAQRLAAKGDGCTISDPFFRFEWSGLNSERARESAAKKLLTELSKLDAAGRQIHLLAHSHGGNVVRRALELGATGKNPIAGRIRSVISFGVPFFHYSIMRCVKSILLNLFAAGAIAAGFAFFIRALKNKPSENLQALYIYVVMILGGMALFFIVKTIIGIARISLQRQRAGSLIGEKVKWKNFCASKDEAISLLMSLNGPLHFLRRIVAPAELWINSPLGCGVGLTLIAMLPAVGFGMWSDLTGPNFSWAEATDGLWPITVTLVVGLFCVLAAVIVVLILAGIFNLVFSLPIFLFSKAVDWFLSSRLRAFAFGDNAGNGLSHVERFPWPATEQCHVAIDNTLEAAMEAYVAHRTRHTMRDLRKMLQPTLPLFSQDWTTILKKALTGDEIAHTVYYHVEAFADLVATTLAETGDWIVRPRSSPIVEHRLLAENDAKHGGH